jgi:hypothetical protein
MVVEGVLLLENYFSLGCVSSEGLLLSLWMMQNSDADDYVEFPLMFTIQNEGESALLHYNLKAEYNATGRTFNLTDPDFVVCNRCPPPFPHAQGSGLSSWLASKCLNCEAPGRLIPAGTARLGQASHLMQMGGKWSVGTASGQQLARFPVLPLVI